MLAHYLAVTLRNLRRAPGTSALNVVTLALGLVAMVTAYAYVAYLDRADRQFPNADRIHLLTMSWKAKQTVFTGTGTLNPQVPEAAAAYLREDFPEIEKIARAMVIDRKTMVASGEHAVRLLGVVVDPEFVDIFGLRFVAGDAATALRSPDSVVLTEEYARELFDERNPLGQRVILQNAVEATVTGVLAPLPEPSHFGKNTPNAQLAFDLLASVDIRDKLSAANGNATMLRKLYADNWYGSDGLTYVLLPAKGLSAPSLSAQLDGFVKRHVPAERQQAADYRFGLMPLHDLHVQANFQNSGVSFGTALLALGALVLSVACVNYANLATARAGRRAREIGVRKAIGAAGRQVLAQSLFEAGVLTVASLVLAVAVFLLAGPVTKDLLSVNLAPTLFADWRVWPFLFGVAAAVAVAAGFYPAFVLSRVSPASAIAAGNAPLGSKLFSLVLVGTQFAVASLLLLVVTFVTLQNAEVERTGLDIAEDPLLVLENPADVTKIDRGTLRSELARVPGITGVTEMSYVPWEMLGVTAVNPTPDPMSPVHRVIMRQVGLDFFTVFGIDVLAGRAFEAPDVPTGAPPAADAPKPEPKVVIDRAFAAELGYATPAAAVGNAVYLLPSSGFNVKEPVTWRIVGVVENRSFSFVGFQNATSALYAVNAVPQYAVARISRNDIAKALDGIDAMWKRLAPNVAINRRFLDDVFNQAYSSLLRTDKLFGLLALAALAISVAGLFGMATLVTARRRPEIGIRKTLGASTAQVLRLLLGSFSKPVVLANVVAWPLGLAGARLYLNQFAKPIPVTFLPFAVSLAVTVAVACLAVGSQTWRAARLRPADVLRNE